MIVPLTIFVLLMVFVGWLLWRNRRSKPPAEERLIRAYRVRKEAHLRNEHTLKRVPLTNSAKELVCVASNPHLRDYLLDLHILRLIRETWIDANARAIPENWPADRYPDFKGEYHRHFMKMTCRDSPWQKFTDYEYRIGNRKADPPDTFYPPKE
ncbi:hypothetical protein [Stenotrophomonas sp. GD03657]|uniref:hypothetical protein n=1 Tax=Stenotrophomonas sp. GD03657 TaxID=2975363 RepID=UPI0024491666|nr:hypothetical protein [Stenotrophomonas sp. GD03657]MDH2154069.1 hypothetical protein [Stenotrophomonas sp. GD03657]